MRITSKDTYFKGHSGDQELEKVNSKNEKLNSQLAARDLRIRALEKQIEQ